MKKIIYVAVYMIILSSITLGSTISEVIMNLLLAALLWLVAHYCYQLVQKINAVHEFSITHVERHKGLEKEIERIDRTVAGIQDELKRKMNELNDKMDDFMMEMRRDRNK